MKTYLKYSIFCALALSAAACSDDDDDTDGGVQDTGVRSDAGLRDTGFDDAGRPVDSGTPDAGTPPAPRGRDNWPVIGTQIDRMGRPAISTALIATFELDAAEKGTLKDAYNAAGKATWNTFAAELEVNLGALDSLDGTCGNQLGADPKDPNGRYAALAAVLSDDQLYVNTATGTCGVYLGYEAEVLAVVEPGQGGCGGRTLVDDVIDRSYSVLAAGILAGVGDGVEADDVATSSTTFPFVAGPTDD